MNSFWFIVLLCITPALSHTYLSSVTINGNRETSCVRAIKSNLPIASVNSNDMMCGLLPRGATPAPSKCPIEAGSKIGLQWNHNSPTAEDDIVDPSHKGPCMVYLSGDNGVSWFKIFESGYDETKKEFCVTTLIANKGYMEVTIPSDIAPGQYLMRGEVIALHEGNKLNGAQPYVACAELDVSGSGSAKPTGVKFPGAYTPTDPGILYDLYAEPMAAYVVPGPPVYGGSSSGSESVTPINSDATPAPISSDATPAPISSDATPAPISSDATPAPISSDATPAPISSDATPAPTNPDATAAPINSDATPAPNSPADPSSSPSTVDDSDPSLGAEKSGLDSNTGSNKSLGMVTIGIIALGIVLVVIATMLVASVVVYRKKGHLFGFTYEQDKGVHRAESEMTIDDTLSSTTATVPKLKFTASEQAMMASV